jgi:quercetin dioxygenase-like cupin family protein
VRLTSVHERRRTRDTISHQFRPDCGVGSMLAAIGGACAATACHHGTGGKEGHRVATWRTFLAHRKLYDIRAGTNRRGHLGAGRRIGGQSLAVHARHGGRVVRRRRKSGRGWSNPRVIAPQYLLRINAASGTPGSTTPVHTHPGSETFFVLTGAQSVRTPHGLMVVKAGEAQPGHGAGVPMQVSASGSTDLHALVMFVLDATKPFSSPANFP